MVARPVNIARPMRTPKAIPALADPDNPGWWDEVFANGNDGSDMMDEDAEEEMARKE